MAATFIIQLPAPYDTETIEVEYIKEQSEEYVEIQNQQRTAYGTLKTLATAAKEVWNLTSVPMPFADYYKLKNYLKTRGFIVEKVYIDTINSYVNAKVSLTSERVMVANNEKNYHSVTLKVERQ